MSMTAATPHQSSAAAAPPDRSGVGTRRILFSVRNLWYLKFYDSVIRSLAARGHDVRIVADLHDPPERTALVDALRAEYPTVSYSCLERRTPRHWEDLAGAIRRSLEYLRFLEPRYEQAAALRRRASRHAPEWLTRMMARRWRGRTFVARALERTLSFADRAALPTKDLTHLIEAECPDLVLVSPLVWLGSTQSTMVRAARRAGVPVTYAVGSWDHLSSKARVCEMPDWVFVWNETQRREAVEYHGVPAGRVVVTGAQCFDEWFERSPSRSRSAFCRQFGFPEDNPIVLYVCSALLWGSPQEAGFVRRWLAAVRSAPDTRLRNASVIIRPHPKRGHEWKAVDLGGDLRTVIWPPLGQAPIAAHAKADYFDSLYHADAVVGLNTSAQIEAALIGRPVYTVLVPEFRDNQEGTLHFHYLLDERQGVLHAARSFDDHVVRLAAGLADPPGAAARNQQFVRTFVRPCGLDRSATEVFVEALENLAATPHRRRATIAPMVDAATRVALWPVAIAVHRAETRLARMRTTIELARLPEWAWRYRHVVYPARRLFASHGVARERLWRQARLEAKAKRHQTDSMGLERVRQAQKARLRAARERTRTREIAATRKRKARQHAARARQEARRKAIRQIRKQTHRWRARALAVFRRLRAYRTP